MDTFICRQNLQRRHMHHNDHTMQDHKRHVETNVSSSRTTDRSAEPLVKHHHNIEPERDNCNSDSSSKSLTKDNHCLGQDTDRTSKGGQGYRDGMETVSDHHSLPRTRTYDEDSDIDVEDDLGNTDACLAEHNTSTNLAREIREDKPASESRSSIQEKDNPGGGRHILPTPKESRTSPSSSSGHSTPYYRRLVSSSYNVSKVSPTSVKADTQRPSGSPKYLGLQKEDLRDPTYDDQARHIKQDKKRHKQLQKHQEQGSPVSASTAFLPAARPSQFAGGFPEASSLHLPLKPRPSPHPALNPALAPAFNPYTFGLTNHSQFLESKLALMSNYNISVGRFPALGLTPDPRLCVTNPRLLPLMGQSMTAAMSAGSSVISSLFPLQIKEHHPLLHTPQTN